MPNACLPFQAGAMHHCPFYIAHFAFFIGSLLQAGSHGSELKQTRQ